jgi:hypothetical protein
VYREIVKSRNFWQGTFCESWAWYENLLPR